MPPLKKSLHMLVGKSVHSFDFQSIPRECLDLPSSNLVHTSLLGSRETLLILGSLGQRPRTPGSNLNVPKPFPINNSRTPWPTFLKLCPNIYPWQKRKPIDFGVTGSKVKVTGVQMCQNGFRSIARERHDLPSSNFVHTSVLGFRGTLWILGHWVKGQGHQGQMCQNCFRFFK